MNAMVLRKCPSCKNVVSMDSYCCPRCGKSFTAARVRRIVFWLAALGAVVWFTRHYWRAWIG
jgi:predicted amidophosphoribosyltransferase